MSVRDAGTGVHVAWNPCSPSPESMFTIPGIRVHDALEWMFTFGWNLRSRCPGIRSKRRIESRLRPKNWLSQDDPMFKTSNIHYELSERTRGVGVGGIGAVHKFALASGLVEAIDKRVDVLKVRLLYHESDHVLNIAYNILSGGTCLEDIELLRNDEVYLDALGAQRIQDPTTGGDFCHRFEEEDINGLMEAFNEVHPRM